MNKTNKQKGFTLAELLIVVAIIAVLTAVAVPVFSSQLERSSEAADLANIRSSYATILADAMMDEKGSYSASVELKQKTPGWQTETADDTLKKLVGDGNVQGSPQKDGRAAVIWQNGVLKISFEGSLPVTYSADDLSNAVVMSKKYGQIVSYLQKNSDMPKMNSRYDYCGEGASDADKVKIITVQTGDGQTQKEIKSAMKKLGYSDSDIDNTYTGQRYAYLDGNGNLLAYHGAGAGGRTQLYIEGYGSNPVSVGGAVEARSVIAEFVRTGKVAGK